MADTPPPRQMSLIPYPYQNGEVVLRRGNDVVVYDAQSRSLSVRNTSEDAVELNECPYCHRPFRDDVDRETADRRGRPGSGYGERPIINPDYFDMLAASRRPSPVGSAGTTTPVNRFYQPALRSGRSRDVSGAHDPPTGAEFVGSEPSASAREGISSSAFSPGYFRQFFREIQELGRGGNGVVLLVEHVMDRVSLGQFACKRVPVGNDHDWLEKVLVEVKLLQKIPHKNLVAYHWVWLEDHQPSTFGPSIPCLWMLQDFCNGGDLHSYVLGPKSSDDYNDKEKLKERVRRHSKGDLEPPVSQLRGPSKLTFDDIFSFFRDITSGLHHLHSRGYIHRDLKPSNCLIQRDGARLFVLISDFGEVQAAGAKRGSTGATGTISYCAPEVLQQNPADGSFGDFTTKSDIFSLGMIVYFMCFGRLPYTNADDINEENEDMDELRAEITKWPGFDDELRSRPDLPEKLYRYLKRLLSVDPNERPSTEDILVSIKGGVGLGETGPTMFEDTSSRVSSIDSPRHRPSPQGRKGYVSRPGLSSLSRHLSENDIRPTSPIRPGSGGLRRGSPTATTPGSMESSTVIRRPPRHVDLPPPTPKDARSPQQSPRLMLPPPPSTADSLAARLFHLTHHPLTHVAFRTALFVAKVLSLTLPCSPFVTNAWLLYPLLAVAALDLGLLRFEIRRSVLLLAAHVTTVILAAQQGRLCEFRKGDGWMWEDVIHGDG
ncbi:putative serine/threonine-protein kinase iks1 [Saxophila tyrrhenica]|uniref:non-specific serine/threonine protein kinase n=1 Tax=Saxophila tyrrhenica TaxID=1690608 RepID=A0AAV9P6S8_9PEZI|nr:putative serine/threonine-protein kinase iks1 [Saxophila tyrrhenica]